MRFRVNETMTKMVPVNCNTVEKETSDSIEKGTKGEKDKKVRDITMTKKCDLKMKRVRERNIQEDTEDPNDKMVTVSIAQLENLMNMFDAQGNRVKDTGEKTKVRLSSLGILLASPDLMPTDEDIEAQLAEKIRHLVTQTLEEKKRTKQSKRDIRKKQKEYDEKRAKQRKKERDLDPLLSVKQELGALANGIQEDEELDEKKKKKAKKKQCHKGNAKHYPADHPKAGEFAPRDSKEGSWSMFFTKGSDCKRGRSKLSGGSEQFTKADNCGRKTKDGDTKNQYKCSKPKEKYSEEQENG